MGIIELVLIVVALVLLLLAGLGVPSSPRFNLLAFGIFFAVFAFALPVFASA